MTDTNFHSIYRELYRRRLLNPLYFDLGMTMDVHPRSRAEPSPQILSDKSSATPSPSPTLSEVPAPQKPAKRSFDVAFLMAPDDLSTKKRQQQQQQLRLVSSSSLMQRYSPPEMTLAHATEAEELKISRSLNHQRFLAGRNYSGYPTNSPTSPLGLLIPSTKSEPKTTANIDLTQDEQNLQFAKSAFTKVKSMRLDLNGTQNFPASPSSASSTVSGGVSPDVTYQESLSPPMANNNSRSPVNYLQSKMAYFAAKNLAQINPQYFYNHAKDKGDEKLSSPLGTNGFLGSLLNKGPPETMQKLRPMLYQSEGLPYAHSITAPSYPFPPNLSSAGNPHSLLTAASVTAALLPTSLAALTLPAQNVCAKCKISFRMTSDLVYHMRSHHKGEHVTTDAVRRRRELDKLRCPVCNETFRERHHLTRHMTAHQDKAGDHDDEDDALELSRRRSMHK